jgi:4-hydroxy-tetrahydrodipicolinate synthase
LLPDNEHRLPLVPAAPDLTKRLDDVLNRCGLLRSEPLRINVTVS